MVKEKKADKAVPSVLSKQAIAILGLFLVIGSVAFFAPYMGVICLSAILAYVFLPLYKKFNRRLPDLASAWLVIFVVTLIIVIPTAYILIVVIDQIVHAIAALTEALQTEGSNLDIAIERVANFFGGGAANGQNSEAIQSSIDSFIGDIIPSILNHIVNSLPAITASLSTFFISIMIFAFLFSVILRKNEQIGQFIYDISPLDRGVTGIYLGRSSQIVIASLKGQLLLSFMSATLAALIMIPLGYGEYFMFMVILFTVLNMIPAGSGIVVIPLCLIAMISDFWLGFWVLMIYLIIIGNSETVVRPKLIPKSIDLIPALSILSIFCGIYYFGIMGVVYGPLIVILLTTTANILVDQKKLHLEKQN